MANTVPYVKDLTSGQSRPLGTGDQLVSADGTGALAADYVGRFEQASLPTVVQIPDTKWGYWYDTINSRLYLVRNRGGAFYQVEAGNPVHAKVHSIFSADHAPGTNGTLLGTESSALAEKAFGTAATAGNIVQRDGSGDVIVPAVPGSSTAAASKAYVDGISLETPRWYKITRTDADLAFAGLTNDIDIFTLPAGGVIHAVKIKHSVAFSGGAITEYYLSVGIAADLDKYASSFDVFQGVSGTTFQLSNSFGSENHGATTSIRLAATAVGANLDQATAGTVDVWLLVSTAV